MICLKCLAVHGCSGIHQPTSPKIALATPGVRWIEVGKSVLLDQPSHVLGWFFKRLQRSPLPLFHHHVRGIAATILIILESLTWGVTKWVLSCWNLIHVPSPGIPSGPMDIWIGPKTQQPVVPTTMVFPSHVDRHTPGGFHDLVCGRLWKWGRPHHKIS